MKKPTPRGAGQPPKAPALTPEIRAKIAERNQIAAWLKQGKTREEELRRELVAFFVPKPMEGANSVAGEGYETKVGHKVSRRLDAAALDAVMLQFPEGHPARVIGNLIQYKPALVLEFYRTLSEQDRKIFDQCLTISDEGLPTLEIVLHECAESGDRQVSETREIIDCNKDVLIGQNAAGECLFRHVGASKAYGGQIYRLRFDRNDRPNGYPDFGGDLVNRDEASTGSRAQRKVMTQAEFAAHVGSSTNPTKEVVARAIQAREACGTTVAKPSAKKPAPKRKK